MNRLKLVLLFVPFALMNAGCAGVAKEASTTTPATPAATAPVAPSITAQPASQAVTTGQPATFTVAATGTGPLTYQWQKNGTALTGATSSTYITSGTTSSDNGSQFRVVVTNAAGNTTSNAATLTVDAAPVAPSITAQPASQAVTAGQTATFTITAVGTAPLIYQWEKNGAAIAGATSSTYTTSGTTSSDSGSQFRVAVTNAVGNTTSNAATLTVNVAPVAPSITAQPASQAVTAGQTATFAMTAVGTAPLIYQWEKNGAGIAGATSSTYTTPVTTSTDNGAQFKVTVSNSVGSAASNAATLTVNAAPVAPSITAQPASQAVTAGQTATFAITAVGTAPLIYQWEKNGAAIAGATSSTYTTSATTSADSGSQFRVAVTNAVGNTTSNAATLTVNAAPVAPSITAQPANQAVTAGQTATFTITAVGTAPLIYQWEKNGAAIAGATSSTYTTPVTTSTDNGAQFKATVSNSVGSATSNAATLTVNAAPVAPSITAQPASQAVTAGQTAIFTITAVGTAPLTYQWEKNGAAIAGATSSTYTTPVTTSTDNGAQFKATVNNSVGSATSNAATLTVNAASSSLQITTSQLPGGFRGLSYSSTLGATGGTTPYTWSIASGALPSGLTLASNGAISGTPTSAGSFSFSAQVKDAAAASASANLSINIAISSPSVTITSPSSGSTVSGITTVSGTASDSVSISSVQLSVDSGSFAGTSGTSTWSTSLNTNSLSNGSHTLTAKATDAAGVSTTSSPVAITVSNGSLASDCTLFASPSGNDSNSGASSSSPKSFQGAANATQPGSVLCLLGGTYDFSSSFTPPNSGSSSSWIVYKNYGDAPVNIRWTGAADASPMFRLGTGGFPSGGPSYLEFRGLNLDGLGNAGDAFFCSGTHHLRFISNSMSNTGGSGVGSRDCDYLTADHNVINHNGYMPASTSVPQWYGWTSGISYNSNQWFDNYPGFHNIISNNIVVGEYDSSANHTDGNGIILDLSNGSYSPSTANTPPVLIVNNVVYGNGGRCIHAFIVTNFWIVNNTCYKNNLDPTLGTAGSFSTNGSQNGYFINNLSVAWSGSYPTYIQESSNSNIQYFADMYYGSSPNFSSAQLIQADPLFLNPPSLSGGQYATALAAALLGDGLTLLPLSPAYGRGIDPSTLSGVPSAIVSDLKNYIYTDINGKARPQGGGSDLGAYQH